MRCARSGSSTVSSPPSKPARARERLVILEARLATAVARAADVALSAPAAGFADVEQDVDSLVTELEALAQATAELA